MSTRLFVFLPLFAWASALAQAGDLDLSEGPAEVRVEGEGFTNVLKRAGGTWTDGRVTVTFAPRDGGRTAVKLSAPDRAVEAVRVSWRARFPRTAMMLSDDWCGLGWKPIGDARSSAWYFLVSSGGVTDGFGVMTRPASIAHWTVRADRVSLFLDVSAGGYGVRLGGRVLEACTLVSRRGRVGETAFEAGRAFCRAMCPKPRLPREPVFGYNDWYCAYGANTASNFLADAAYVAALAKDLPIRPFVVMDDGWQPMSPPAVQKKTGKLDSGWGPWDRASDAFGMTMPDFAARIAALGAKPGLWYRPMRAWDEAPDGWKVVGHPESFDPTVPAVMEAIRADMRRFREWGFALVKMDFLVYDFNGHYLFPGTIDESVFKTRRPWRDRSRTSAERMLDLYRALREAAGDEITLIGCGAFGHLAAGLFEVNRIGFDTSGREWARTARNGPNALGMRLIQHGTFYAVDPDCVGLAAEGAIPWEKNGQWLDLIAGCGVPLFISWRRQLAGQNERMAFSAAFAACAAGKADAEPMDWMTEDCPRRWRIRGDERLYDWSRFCAGLPAHGICAHRGDRDAFPENTVPALVSAARKGAAMVEFDVTRCRTGELVVMHDPTVDRTTTGSGKVSELDFGYLRSLDAGVKKDVRFSGTVIPTFDEAIDCLPKSGLWINVHCKSDVAVDVAEGIRAKGRLHQAFVAASLPALRRARERVPGLLTCNMSRPSVAPRADWPSEACAEYVRETVRNGCEFLQMVPASRRNWTKEIAGELHAENGKVNFFLSNHPEHVASLLESGIDFILTDRLDEMLKACRSAGL